MAVKIRGDVVVGCDTGALLFYEMNALQNNVAVVPCVALASPKEILPDKIKFNSFMRLCSPEPVTHVYEIYSGTHAGMLLTGQIDGSILVVNYVSQSIVLQVQLQSPPTKLSSEQVGQNCLFFMRPYSDAFHIDHNPVIMVND